MALVSIPAMPRRCPLADEALLLQFVSNLKNVVLDQQSEPSSPKLFLEAITPAVSTSEADFVQFPEHQTSPAARRGKRAADPTMEELVKRMLKLRHLDGDDSVKFTPFSTTELADKIGKDDAGKRYLVSPRTVGRRMKEIFNDPNKKRGRHWKTNYMEVCKSKTVDVYLNGLGEQFHSSGTTNSQILAAIIGKDD